jgi:thiosulfate reductase cytochrome b subunit
MEKIYYYPIWIRVWHTINALTCLLLIVTGMSMQYSNIQHPIIRFDIAVAWHNGGGIVLTVNYLIFFIGNLIFKNGSYYKIKWKGIGTRLLNQFTYYLYGIFTSAKAPYPASNERKFNPLQQFSYVIVMYLLVPALFITGWILLFPGIVVNDFVGSKGLFVSDLLHVIAGFLVSLFMVIHIYFCTLGYKVSSHFKAMITGYHEIHDH